MLFTNLLKNRKSQLAQVNKIKQGINKLLSEKMTSQIVSDISKYSTLCKETLETQTTLLEMPLPDLEYEKQQNWLAQKTKETDTFENDVNQWLTEASAKWDDKNVDMFDGDPLKYAAFIRAFEQAIERKTADKEECLYYLEPYTRGQPRELVRSCYNMARGQGYERAKTLLKEHFGNEMRIAVAYIERVIKWPTIKVDDTATLSVLFHPFNPFKPGKHYRCSTIKAGSAVASFYL